MAKIINFKSCTDCRRGFCMYEEIMKKIQEQKKEKKDFTIKDVEKYSAKILKSTQRESGKPTKIIAIAEAFGFKVFQQVLPSYLSGFIGIGKMMKEKFNYNKVICVNITDEIGHQRFVIGHELAHYLFDYNGKDAEYYDTYLKNNHDSYNEKRANKFSASLLMPYEDFLMEMAKMDEDDLLEAESILMKTYKVQDKAVRKRFLEVAFELQEKRVEE